MLLLLTGLFTTITSYVIWFMIPHGMGAHGEDAHCSGGGVGFLGNTDDFLGIFRYTWIDIHNWAAVVLAAMLAVHLYLNWQWVEKTCQRIFSDFSNTDFKVRELFSSAALLLFLFVFEGISGLLLWLVLPRGERDHSQMKQGMGRTLLGLQRNIWVDLHAWLAVIILALVVIHLILNWKWVIGTTRKVFSKKLRSE